jgi:DNA-binding protein H-NS
VKGHFEGGDEMGDRVHIVRKSDNRTIVENVLKKQEEHAEFRDDEDTDDYLELQSAHENELQENLNQQENENITCQQDWETEVTQRRNHYDAGPKPRTVLKNMYKRTPETHNTVLR